MLRKIKSRLGNFDKKLNDLETIIEKIDLNQKILLNKISNSGYIKLSDKEVMTKIFSGAKMYLDPRDASLVPHLILDGNWEWDITQAWLRTVKDDDVVFDIGANFGYFGLLSIQQTNKKSKAILFEANPALIPYIEKTLMVNSFSANSKVENLAVAEKVGKLELSVVQDYIASSSLRSTKEIKLFTKSRDEVNVDSVVKVNSITVDKYCKLNDISKVNLIKMDIEGYEDRAYEGMRGTVKQNSDITMFIEFTKDAYKDAVKFYETMLNDFGNVYLISNQGALIKQKNTSFEVVVKSEIEWVMLVFSKNSRLV